MNKNYNLFLITLVSFLNLSLSSNQYDFEILDDRDFELQENQNHPTLHSSPGEEPYWESFNEWQCFPAYSVQMHCYDEDGNTPENFSPEERDGQLYSSTITLWHENHFLLFESVYRTRLPSCLKEVDEWIKLIENQEAFCLFAAYLPGIEEEEQDYQNHMGNNYWIVYGIKTLSGRIMAPIYEDEEATATESEQFEQTQPDEKVEDIHFEEQSIDLDEM